jgi:hypothetical protein
MSGLEPWADVASEAIKAVTGNREAVNEAAKAAPGMAVVGDLRAENLALLQVLQNWLLKGVVKTVLGRNEYVRSGQIYRDLSSKLSGIEADHLQPPKASIAGPVIEGIAYVLDEPALKEMYLNLLAGAVNSAKAPKVHPSFVEIIRQLSAQEVPVLELALSQRSLAAVRLQDKSLSDSSFQIEQTCVLDLVQRPSGGPLVLGELPIWVDNWQRLGLVGLTYTEWLSNSGDDADLYGWAKERPEYLSLVTKIEERGLSETREAAYDRGILRATPLGLRFHEIVSQPA